MRKLAIGLCLVGAAIGAAVVLRAASASTRSVSATWQSDASRHVDTNFVEVKAISDTGADYSIHVFLRDPSGVIVNGVTCDGEAPFNGDPVIIQAPVTNYASGTVFTAGAEFMDASHNITATQAVQFTKP